MGILIFVGLIFAVIGICLMAANKTQTDTPRHVEPTRQPKIEIQPDTATQQAYAGKKGEAGEERVQRMLSALPSEEYIVLSGVLLPTKSGTTQIDHIVISAYGIFVIEVKNYQGQIYGKKDGDEWKKYINGKEYRFHNPLFQNYAHVKAVAQVIGTSTANIIPLTVFTGNAILKIAEYDKVIYEYSLVPTIKMYNKIVFTTEQARRYASVLDDAIDENPETMYAHTQYVKEVVSQKNREISMGRCPRCHGYLVLRKGKYGDFYGCSNYPDCKYTKNI